MRIAVFGAGGVGGYFGGRLAQVGEDVIFIARGAHLQALQQHGLQVESLKGDFHISPVQATDNPAGMGPVDIALVAVKAWQVEQAAQALEPCLRPDSLVIPLQNGIEAPQQLAQTLGPARVFGGLCRISSILAAPGHIRHVGVEPYVAFGPLAGQAPAAQMALAQALVAAFQRAGVKAEMPPDIQAAMWEKFLFICTLSGVGTVTRAPVGVLRSLPETRALLLQALDEIEAVAQAHGITLLPGARQRVLDIIDTTGPQVTASMQRDILEGRPSELEAQNGAVVRLGQAKGVPTPLHAFIYASLLPQEQRARGEMAF